MNYKLFPILTTALLLAGCKKEQPIVADPVEANFFLPPEGANDPESMLRRQFYAKEGVYLLFSDTLRNEYRGKNSYGEDIWHIESLHIGYGVTDNTSRDRIIPLVGMQQKQQAMDFVQGSILSRLGPALRPYSLLLVKSYELFDRYDLVWTKGTAIKVGFRCLALSLDDLLQDNARKKAFADEVLYKIINAAIQKNPTALSGFYAFTDNAYGSYKKNLGLPDVINDDQARKLGFLKDLYVGYFPSKSKDLEDFLRQVITVRRADFVAAYAAYPILLAKYDALTEVVTKLGFKP